MTQMVRLRISYGYDVHSIEMDKKTYAAIKLGSRGGTAVLRLGSAKRKYSREQVGVISRLLLNVRGFTIEAPRYQSRLRSLATKRSTSRELW
jgi:hypothetical protein